MNTATLYSSEFFASQSDGSARSAAVVVPTILSLLPASSVIDIGCGVGTWAAQFIASGVEDVWGVDGDYVDRTQLRIPDRFLARDLLEPLRLERKFDLAVCLEVAEHLPESRAASLAEDLCLLAPCVLFSAAVPGPTGTGHINAQFLPYWIEMFAAHGYQALDVIRPNIWGNDDVEWFYQQDIVMFASPGHPIVQKGFPRPQSMIHPELYRQALDNPLTLGKLRELPRAVARSIRYRSKRRALA